VGGGGGEPEGGEPTGVPVGGVPAGGGAVADMCFSRLGLLTQSAARLTFEIVPPEG
jgi:hypothetical protein